MAVYINDEDFQNKVNSLIQKVESKKPDMLEKVANEIMRLSQQTVPIYTGVKKGISGGSLQNSGFVDLKGDDVVVGYNIAYAAYQHEGQRRDGSHVVRNYTNPRSQRKFLENPIKNNLEVWVKLGVAVLSPIFK